MDMRHPSSLPGPPTPVSPMTPMTSFPLFPPSPVSPMGQAFLPLFSPVPSQYSQPLQYGNPSLPPPPPHQHLAKGSRWQPPYEPRSVQELCAERDYLLAYLHSRDTRARKLLYNMSSIEREQLPLARTASEARRLRREIGFLKGKLADSAHQEHMTLMRLSDIYMEIQRRERLFHVHQEQQQRMATASLAAGLAPSPYIFSPPMVLHSIGWLRNGEWESLPSARFEGGRPSGGLDEAGGQGSSSITWGGSISSEAALAGTEELPTLQYAYVGVDEEAEEEDLKERTGLSRCPSPEMERAPRLDDRRSSLPTIRFLWPETVEQE